MSQQRHDHDRPVGLVGLQNLGNTCFMNSALQALSNCPQLTEFILTQNVSYEPKRNHSLAKVFFRLIRDIWAESRPSFIMPIGILHRIKAVCPFFRNPRQQDAQEFLRCFLDQLHEELKLPTSEHDGSIVSLTQSSNSMQSPVTPRTKISTSGDNSSSDEDYETCDSGLSSAISAFSDESSGQSTGAPSFDQFIPKFPVGQSPGPPGSSTPSIVSPSQPVNQSQRTAQLTTCQLTEHCEHENNADGDYDDDDYEEDTFVCNAQIDEQQQQQIPLMRQPHPPVSESPKPNFSRPTIDPNTKKPIQYSSVISDLFDGKILSSVQCLTCGNISTTKETFQDLSLPIPRRDHLHLLKVAATQSLKDVQKMPKSSTASGLSSTSSSVQDDWSNAGVRGGGGSADVGIGLFSSAARFFSSAISRLPSINHILWTWFDWIFYMILGPSISLQDCLLSFFSADELKGDDMYHCDKCQKLRNGVKFSKVLSLPDVLCIHLKRFRHEFYSSKICSHVSFPLQALDMASYMVREGDQSGLMAVDPQIMAAGNSKDSTLYNLVAVICHSGTPSFGHYVTFALNATNQCWYEFDDQSVTSVDPYTVASSEAYVLFYSRVR